MEIRIDYVRGEGGALLPLLTPRAIERLRSSSEELQRRAQDLLLEGQTPETLRYECLIEYLDLLSAARTHLTTIEEDAAVRAAYGAEVRTAVFRTAQEPKLGQRQEVDGSTAPLRKAYELLAPTVAHGLEGSEVPLEFAEALEQECFWLYRPQLGDRRKAFMRASRSPSSSAVN